MCTACLIENVKTHMLSRRSLFTGAAATAATGAAAGLLSARPALSQAMGRFGIEGLTNLGQLPATGATIFIGAPKHRGGTGGPARVLAMN